MSLHFTYCINILLHLIDSKIDALIQAKDMVTLADRFASKLEEKQGAVSEDEVLVYSIVFYYYYVLTTCC